MSDYCCQANDRKGVFIMFVGGTAGTIKFFLSVSSAGSAIKPPSEVTAVI